MQLRCLNKALTTGVPGGTIGAFNRKLSNDNTGWKDWNSVSSPTLKDILSQISHKITRSRMIGAASRESFN